MAIRRKLLTISASILTAAVVACGSSSVFAQAPSPLTYPELMTALQTRVPNSAFRTKDELIRWVTTQVRTRKVDKPLTKDREEDLRQAGAPDAMIAAIRESSPAVPVEDKPVDLGELAGRAIDLVRPQYTEEARKARTQGQVKLALEIDEKGSVVSISRLSVLENGLTEQAIEAARRSTFKPALRDGKPARGTGILTFNFKLDLIDISTVLAAANRLRDSRDCIGAVAEYDRILALDKQHAAALFGRATCRLMSTQYDLAVADLTSAASIDPRSGDTFFYLAIAQDFQGDSTSAAGNYRKALQLKSEFDTQNVFRCLFIDQGQVTSDQLKAIVGRILLACNASLNGASENLKSLIHFKRGIAYRLQGEFDRAITDLTTAKRLNPQFSSVNTQLQITYNERGLVAFNKKDFRKALEDVTLAINADPGSSTPYVNRCAIYAFGLKRYSDAINDCTYAIRLSARSSSAFNYRGFAYEMTNDKAAAIADYAKALELDPNNEAARANLNRLQPIKPTLRDN